MHKTGLWKLLPLGTWDAASAFDQNQRKAYLGSPEPDLPAKGTCLPLLVALLALEQVFL